MKRVKYCIAVTVAALGLASCNLDMRPDTGVIGSDVNSIEYVKALRNGLYNNMVSIQSYGNQVYQEYYADLFNETMSSGNRGGYFSRWMLVASDQDVNAIWSTYYGIVSNINYILMKADEVSALQPENAEDIAYYKAEAHMFRAMCFHQLALRFCKDYTPSTAISDLGVPTPVEYDPYAKNNRGTLEMTYKQILDDIRVAEMFLTEAGTPNSTRLSKDAVNAFKAQVALHMHDYDTAIDCASETYAGYPLATSKTQIDEMWHEDNSTETIMQGTLTSTTLGLVSGPSDYLSGTWDFDSEIFHYTPAYLPEQWIIDLYAAEDWRTGTLISKESLYISSDYYMGYVLTKFSGNRNLFTVPTSLTYKNATKLFRVAEMYLIEAEAQYMKGGDALTPLNALRQARGLAALNVSGEELMAEIEKERVRELIGEGHRLFDLKRWGKGFKRNYQTALASALQGGKSTYQMTQQATNPKFVWPIPMEELHANSNFGEQNTGYTSVQ